MAHINQQAMLQQSKKMLEFKTKQTHTRTYKDLISRMRQWFLRNSSCRTFTLVSTAYPIYQSSLEDQARHENAL